MKLPRAKAGELILGRYDRSPVQGEALIAALNLCLSGATVQEFLKEREKSRKKA